MNEAHYQKSKTSQPLRIGILLDSPVLPRVFSAVIDHIRNSDFAEINLLIYNASGQTSATPTSEPKRSTFRRISSLLQNKQARRNALFAAYLKWDRRNALSEDDPQTPIDCTAKLAGIHSIVVQPRISGFTHRFPDAAVEEIREANLDVILRFGFNILRGEILQTAKHGVWSYHHGDNDFYRGGPAHFWEMYEGRAISGVILQILTEKLDAGFVLCKGYFATHPGFSLSRNRIQPYWGSSTFVIQKLRELHMYGFEYVKSRAIPDSPYRGRKTIYKNPSNVEMIRWLLPTLAAKATRRILSPARAVHWRLGVGFSRRSITATDVQSREIRWLDSPRGRFYADPFTVSYEDRWWVFFEDFDYKTNCARISAAELRPDRTIGPAIPALTRPYHLSYPCVFWHGGVLFMVPESRSNSGVELYRCIQFPDQWEFVRVLLPLGAVDTTVYFDGTRFWFFATLVEPIGHAVQLWLYSATSLESKLVPHPQNPISTDVRASRGGGAIFQKNGKLYRPSQDCSGNSIGYGRSFGLNEITQLDTEHYAEHPIMTVEPDWEKDLIGTHTYALAGDLEIIDGCSRVRSSFHNS